jgi:hypothetical protein
MQGVGRRPNWGSSSRTSTATVEQVRVDNSTSSSSLEFNARTASIVDRGVARCELFALLTAWSQRTFRWLSRLISVTCVSSIKERASREDDPCVFSFACAVRWNLGLKVCDPWAVLQEDRQRDGFAPAVTLRLRPKNRVKWGEDVVDNEGMGKRKSNKCCIFHKRKKFGESSSESEYSSGAESGSDSPRLRALDRAGARRQRAECTCEPGQDCDPDERTQQSPGTARRGPFTRRVQDTTSSVTPSSSIPLSPSSPAGLAVLVMSPLSLTDNRDRMGERDRSRDRAEAAAVGGHNVTEQERASDAAHRRDLLTDAAAVECIQAENIHPLQTLSP